MRTHDLKTWPHSFQAIFSRSCTHQFRRDDREFAMGDVLLLREWVPPPRLLLPDGGWGTDPGEGYTGREARRTVTYISRSPDWGIPDGFVVMSLAEEEKT